MPNEGVLITAAVTLGAAAMFGLAARAIYVRRACTSRRALAATSFFGLASALFALMALRQVVAFAGAIWPTVAAFDLLVFVILLVPGSLTVPPLVYLTAFAISGSDRRSLGAAALSLALVSVTFVLIVATGLVGPVLSFWSGEWFVTSGLVAGFVLATVTAPGLAAGGTLLYVGRGEGWDPRRLRLTGAAIVLFYATVTVDLFGVEGAGLLALRVVALVAASLGYVAYRPGIGLAPTSGQGSRAVEATSRP